MRLLAAWPPPRLQGRSWPRKVGHNASQVANGPCVEGRRDPFVQLLAREPALGEVVAEPRGRVLPVMVGDPDTVLRRPARPLVNCPARGDPRSPTELRQRRRNRPRRRPDRGACEVVVGGVEPLDHRVQPEQLGVDPQRQAEIVIGFILLDPGPLLHQLRQVPTVYLDHLMNVGAGHPQRGQNLRRHLVIGR